MTTTHRPTRVYMPTQRHAAMSNATLDDFTVGMPVIILKNHHREHDSWILGTVIELLPKAGVWSPDMVRVEYRSEVDADPDDASDFDHVPTSRPFTPENLLPGTPANLSWLRGRYELAIARIAQANPGSAK